MFGGLHAPGPVPSADALIAVGREFTPRLMAQGPASVLLDLQGLGRTWRTPQALGEGLLQAAARRVPGPQVALSWSRVAALVIARARPGLTVVDPGREAEALAPLPLGTLDLAPERAEMFHRWGLRTLGEVAALPAQGLAERLGPEGPRLLRLARGEDDRPLVAEPPPERFDCTLELDWPVEGLEPLAFLLARVLESLCASLAARGRRAAAVTLTLALVDGRRDSRTLRPAAPSAEARTLRTLLLLDLEARTPGEAVQALTVHAEPTGARSVQFSLLDPAQPSPERLAETLARLHEFTAAGRGGSPRLVDTHRPGAFVMEAFGPPPLARQRAPLPAPPVPRVALRAFRPPLPARVTLKDGVPAFVSAHAPAGPISGPVAACAGPWRASGDWWDVAWSRDEWDAAVGAAVYRLVYDRLRGTWLVGGELD